jgi:Unconventional myosin tail, actin- and lipid-binding
MYSLWRASVILSRIPSHLRLALPQKLAAYEAFNRRRDEWGYERVWAGDYLLESSEHYVDGAKSVYANAIEKLRDSHRFNRVLFSSFIHKINRFVPSACIGMVIIDN